MTTLEGQTVLIVGGSAGIGYGVAKLTLLSKAARVIIASSNKDRVDNAIAQLLAELKKDIPDVKSKVSGDVVNAKVISEVRALVERVGEIDHLVWTSGDALNVLKGGDDIDKYKGIHECRFQYHRRRLSS